MAQKFVISIQTRFRDADPAGFLFYGRVFELAHDGFEDFVTSLGFSWKEWFASQNLMTPIRHAESEFYSPIWPGQTYQLEISVCQIRETSFQLRYDFKLKDSKLASVKLVHACLDAKSKQKIQIPQKIRELLTPYLET